MEKASCIAGLSRRTQEGFQRSACPNVMLGSIPGPEELLSTGVISLKWYLEPLKRGWQFYGQKQWVAADTVLVSVKKRTKSRQSREQKESGRSSAQPSES